MSCPFTLVHDYTRVMLLVLLFKEPKHVTLLGLGGGSLLRVMHKHCTTTVFQVVELRESVIHIALEYFFVPFDDRIAMHTCNGIDYVSEVPAHPPDILFADMYHAYSMDEFQSTTSFLEQSWLLLSEDGWLVINFHQLPKFDQPYMRTMCALFAEYSALRDKQRKLCGDVGKAVSREAIARIPQHPRRTGTAV